MIGKYNWVRMTATGEVSSTPATVVGVLISNPAVATATIINLTNDTDGSSDSMLDFTAIANDGPLFDLTPFGGMYFDTAVYMTATTIGTGSIIHVALDG